MIKSQKFVVVSLCLALLVGMSFAQKIAKLQVQQGESPYIQGAKATFAVIPRANNAPAPYNPDVQVPIWTGHFVFNNQTFTYHMVGTDPAAGSATSNIPLVIIPLKFHFSDGTNLSASQTVCGDVKNTKYRFKNSPLIKNATFTPGGTNVGTTQYVDAFQRANFWNFVSTTSPNYHVRLSPVSTKPLQTINVKTTGPGPFEAKGIGETPTVPTAAAIAGAVADAIGHPVVRLPLTPERVLNALEAD